MMTSPPRLLNRESFPLRLWKKAKAQGVWDPGAIDFSRDRQDWLALPPPQRESLLQLAVLFLAGEQAVTLDLLPLLAVVATEGRLDEEIYLTSFLWEEAKHVDLFSRFFEEVTGLPDDLSRYYPSSFVRLFDEELAGSLRRLETDASPEAQVRACVTYHIAVESVLAETGYYVLLRVLSDNNLLPGMQRAVNLLRRDEARHIAFGVYFLRRLIIEHGKTAYKSFLDRLGELKPLIEELTVQFLSCFAGEHGFDVRYDELVRYARRAFAGRVRAIVQARSDPTPDLDPQRDIEGLID